MKTILAGILLACSLGCSSRSEAPPAQLLSSDGAVTISGPFVHEHLAVYVVENPSAKSVGDFITLAEGLASGQVKVTEKKSAQVNELLIENGSDKPCFVQAGDVVKGGQQDRTLARDFVIPPKTPPTPVASFCVEQSRWSGSVAFQSSMQNAYGRDLKCAIQGKRNQGEVWKQVARGKEGLADNNALPAPTTSSLNEELDSRKIQDRLKAFREALSKAVNERPQAVGLITAVNGRFSTADVYADPGLFRKLFPRLLESAALEALSLKPEATPAPGGAQAAAFLADGEKGSVTTETLHDGLKARTLDSEKCVRFDYLWNNSSLHHQTLSK
ncbi:MAG TPA: DUF6569 family protein [Planctomycetota bacterium]|nr:DUF6569 family protein [Planctomycetota bacterium]